MSNIEWEIVHDTYGERVRRIHVPGGYLYQVELQNYHTTGDGYYAKSESETGWHPPVFVPEVK